MDLPPQHLPPTKLLFICSQNRLRRKFPEAVQGKRIVCLQIPDYYESMQPWIDYGTDWLAFAHLIIAVFFVGPLLDPVRNVWVLRAGVIACIAVVPLALICGAVRQIPFGWRLIDCSFGVFGIVPLLYCLRLIRKLERG
jgi:hypothetical protein